MNDSVIARKHLCGRQNAKSAHTVNIAAQLSA